MLLAGQAMSKRSAMCGTLKAPAGWWCSRPVGHEGPCAARPDGVRYPADEPADATRRFPCPCCNGRGYHDYEPFTPDYAIHPGETIKDVFDENHLSNKVAATALGLSEQYVGEVVNGKKGISIEMAHRLGRVFGPGERFWISLQANYEADCKRIGRKP